MTKICTAIFIFISFAHTRMPVQFSAPPVPSWGTHIQSNKCCCCGRCPDAVVASLDLEFVVAHFSWVLKETSADSSCSSPPTSRSLSCSLEAEEGTLLVHFCSNLSIRRNFVVTKKKKKGNLGRKKRGRIRGSR